MARQKRRADGRVDPPELYPQVQPDHRAKKRPAAKAIKVASNKLQYKPQGPRPQSGQKRLATAVAAQSAGPSAPTQIKRQYTKRRHRPGVIALKEIKKYQASVESLIPKAPFARLCKETLILLSIDDDTRWSGAAVQVLQEAAEAHIVQVMENTNDAAIHAGRVTIMPKDLALVMQLRPDSAIFKQMH